MTTGLVWDERFFWYDFGDYRSLLGGHPWLQPGSFAETAESKRRILNLLHASGMMDALAMLSARRSRRAGALLLPHRGLRPAREVPERRGWRHRQQRGPGPRGRLRARRAGRRRHPDRHRCRAARHARQCLCAGAPARSPRRARPGRRTLHLRQRGGRHEARDARAWPLPGGDRGLGCPPRQRHRIGVLRRSLGAHDLHPPGPHDSRPRRSWRQRARPRRGLQHQHPAAAGRGHRRLPRGDRPRGGTRPAPLPSRADPGRERGGRRFQRSHRAHAAAR